MKNRRILIRREIPAAVPTPIPVCAPLLNPLVSVVGVGFGFGFGFGEVGVVSDAIVEVIWTVVSAFMFSTAVVVVDIIDVFVTVEVPALAIVL